MGLRFTAPRLEPFYGRGVGSVFAINPELLNANKWVRPVLVDMDVVQKFDEAFDYSNRVGGFSLAFGSSPAVLLLSQPHYRVTSEANFLRLLSNVTHYLRSRGYERLFVQLHPSEDSALFAKYYRPFDFQEAFQTARSPVEARLHAVPSNTALVSFNSSALLNARKFGFRGKVISYGLNWISDCYPFQRALLNKQRSLFVRSGVEIVLDTNRG
jgi:hypothetical protein